MCAVFLLAALEPGWTQADVVAAVFLPRGQSWSENGAGPENEETGDRVVPEAGPLDSPDTRAKLSQIFCVWQVS